MGKLETEFKPPHENFGNVLEQFLTKQQQLKKSGAFDPFLVKTRKPLRTAVKKSNWFKELYSEAIDRFLVPLNDENSKDLKDCFAGAVWENLAYHFLSAQQPDSRVVLSPKQTFELVSLILEEKNEDYQIIPNPFKIMGIKGRGLPDGIIYDLKTQRSLSICEYTCSGSRNYFSRKIKNFRIGKKYRPGLYANTQLLFAIPNNYQNLEEFFRNEKSKLEIVPVPFANNQFREFNKGIFVKYRPDTPFNLPSGYHGNTLSELQESARQDLMKAKITTNPSEFFNLDISSIEGRSRTAIKI